MKSWLVMIVGNIELKQLCLRVKLKNIFMKKMNFKKSSIVVVMLLVVNGFMVSCSKDSGEEKNQGTIDIAVGTYKGTLNVYGDLHNSEQYKFYDAVLIVTKVDKDHLKVTAKSGEDYSAVTEKVFKVEPFVETDVHSVIGNLSGSLWYTADAKSIYVQTEAQSATDIEYSFDGAKQ